MRKKIKKKGYRVYEKSTLAVLTVALLLLVPSGSGGVQVQQVRNPYTYTVATIGEPYTLDPHWAYDTASAALIFNVYETLVDFMEGRTDANIPELATDWAISSDGLTYTFQIRTGVNFTNGNPLTPEDVEYSFERGMVRDRSGGPMWMLYEPLIGIFRSRSYGNLSDPTVAEELGQKIDVAIESNATHVWFNLAEAGLPYPPFIQILSQSWASILDKEWMTRTITFDGGATDSFDWPGWVDHKQWVKYNDYAREQDPAYFDAKVSPLDSPPQMMGTGPFTFTEWVYGEGGYTTLSRNADYWGGWPAGAAGTARYRDFKPSRGYIETYQTWQISEWSSRKAGFLDGTYDTVYVPRGNMDEVWQQPGIRVRYPMPSLVATAVFFNFNISTVNLSEFPNEYMGVPGGLPPNTFNETGIPPDFFSDVHVRKGFAYCFNYTKYIEEMYLGEATQPATPVVQGLPYHNPATPKYAINLTMAAEEFQLAWDGQVWANGFMVGLPYRTGQVTRQKAWEMLKANVESLNPKFHIEVIEVWSIWLPLGWPYSERQLPLFLTGWLADYPDPHNFVHPFMHSEGYFAYLQSYSNATVDALVEEGMRARARREIYYELQKIYHDDVPSVPLVQSLWRHWERDWVQGWYFNPIFPRTNLYTIWKEDLPWEDVNADGKVDIKDLTTAAKAFGSYFIADLPPYPTGPLGTFAMNWDSRADINQDMKVNIADLTKMAKRFGNVVPFWTPPP